jgi:ribonuclease HI
MAAKIKLVHANIGHSQIATVDQWTSDQKKNQTSRNKAVKKIIFLQQNLQRCRSAMDHIIGQAKYYDILLLQEPYVGNTGRVTSPHNLTIYQADGTSENPCKAVIIISNPNLRLLWRSDISDQCNAFATLKSGTLQLTIGSIYIPPPSSALVTLQKIEKLGKDKGEYIIGGDFNAKSSWWGSPKNDKRGDEVISCLASIGWHVCNEGSVPTYSTWRNGKHLKSHIDITISSPNTTHKIANWTVEDQHNPISDHNPITFTWNNTISVLSPMTDSTRIFITNEKTDWRKINELTRENMAELNIDKQFLENIHTTPELDTAVETVTSAISIACHKILPQKTQHDIRKNPIWWNAELTKMKRITLRSKRKLQNSSDIMRPQKLTDYIDKREAYKTAIEEAKIKSAKLFYESQTPMTAWSSLYKITKKTNASNIQSTLTTEGVKHSTAKDSAKALMEKFFPYDDPTTDTPIQHYIRHTSDNHIPGGEDDIQFTLTEILSALQNMTPKKAPGHDNLTLDICQNFAKNFPEEILLLYNKCLTLVHFPKSWKISIIKAVPKPGKDAMDTKSYRPIGLLPVFGKVLEKLAIQRVHWHLTKNNKLSTKQFGFTPQTSTEHALNKAVHTISTHLELKESLIAISLDIQGAFDNAWWPHIKNALAIKSTPPNLYKLFCSYLQDREVKLKYADEEIKQDQTQGCIQGSTCGPTLWNIALDSLLTILLPHNTHIQAFADDVLILIAAKDTDELELKTNSVLQKVNSWGEDVKLTFSDIKTNIMFINKRKIRTPEIQWKGKPKELVDSFKILGIILDRHINWAKHVDYICKKAAQMGKFFLKTARATWGASPEVLKIIYHGAVEPTLTYAASVWNKATHRKSIQKRLNSAQRPFAISICKGYRTISLTSAQALAGIAPIDIKIQELTGIYQVKTSHILPRHLPTDRTYENKIHYTQLPHPGNRHLENIEHIGTVDEDTKTKYHITGLEIYTDGSLIDNKVGAAFVAYENGTLITPRKFKLESYCTVFQAEIFAIRESLEWTLKRLKFHRHDYVNIFSDSQSSLVALQNPSSTHPLVRDILTLSTQLRMIGTNPRFFWIRSHTGIAENEEADKYAKQATTDKRPLTYTHFPLSYAKQKLNEDTIELWNHRYTTSATGSITQKFIPNINCAITLARNLKISHELTQILTGHGSVRAYLKRFKLRDDDCCPCDGNTSQTVWHVINDCPILERERWTLRTLRTA